MGTKLLYFFKQKISQKGAYNTKIHQSSVQCICLSLYHLIQLVTKYYSEFCNVEIVQSASDFSKSKWQSLASLFQTRLKAQVVLQFENTRLKVPVSAIGGSFDWSDVIEYFIQIQSKRQMSSNNLLPPQKALYLKQFFTNYFQRKHTLETISAFTNGLRVIDCLIQQFEHTQNISRPQRAQKYSPNSISSLSQMQVQEKNVNLLLEDIYNRLSHIFEKVKQESESENLFGDRKQQAVQSSLQDEQLYEILNKYKNDYKRQKEERIRAEKQINKLKENLELNKLEKEKFCEKIKGAEKMVQSLRKINANLQETIQSLKEQVGSLKHQKNECLMKLQDYQQLQTSFELLNKDYQLLVLKYDQSQQNERTLKEKFKGLDAIVKVRIEQSQAKWSNKINEKLSQKDIFDVPACKAFKQFVKSFNKENRQVNKTK